MTLDKCRCNKELSEATCGKHIKAEIMEKESEAIRRRLIDMRSGKEMAAMCGCSQAVIATWLRDHRKEGEGKTYELLGTYYGNNYYNFSYPAVLRFLRENSNELKKQKKQKNRIAYIKRKATKNAFKECIFFCRKCNEDVEAMPDSTAVRSYRDGELSLQEAKRLLLNAHLRHEHSNYDELVSEYCRKEWEFGKDLDYETRLELIKQAKIKAKREAKKI